MGLVSAHRLPERVAKAEPVTYARGLITAFKELVKSLRGAIPLEMLQHAATTGNFTEVLAVVDDSALVEAAINRYAAVASKVVAAAGWKEIKRLGVENFTISNEVAEHLAKTRSMTLVSGINASVKESLRKVLGEAFESGEAPFKAARHIKELIGLGPRDARAVQRYRSNLLKSGMKTPNADELAGKYADRLLTKRSQMIAVTETMWAENKGSLELWKAAAQQGGFADMTMKRWSTAWGSERTCEYCRPMHGQTVRLHESFTSEIGPIDHPPLHPRCRCSMGLVTVVEGMEPLPFLHKSEQQRGQGQGAAAAVAAQPKAASEATVVGKHLPGQHNQKDHGHRGFGTKAFYNSPAEVARRAEYERQSKWQDTPQAYTDSDGLYVAMPERPLDVNGKPMDLTGKHLYATDLPRQEGGAPVRGTVMSKTDPRIPDEVYHVSPAAEKINAEGRLRASGKGGLGGDDSDHIVSMTVDKGVAQQLQKDMQFMARISAATPEPPPWASPTMKDTARRQQMDAARAEWGRKLNDRFVEQSHREGWEFKGLIPELAFTSYNFSDMQHQFFQYRQSRAGIRDPLFFGDSRGYWSTINPAKIGIVTIPKARLAKTKAMLTDFDLDSAIGLKEIRLYGDVSLRDDFTKHLPGRHNQKDHGRKGSGGHTDIYGAASTERGAGARELWHAGPAPKVKPMQPPPSWPQGKGDRTSNGHSKLGMSNSKMGILAERLLDRSFGVRRYSTASNAPFDLVWGRGKNAILIESKACSKLSGEYKIKSAKAARSRKEAAARKAGLRVMTMIPVVSKSGDRFTIDVYSHKGFWTGRLTPGTLKDWSYHGSATASIRSLERQR